GTGSRRRHRSSNDDARRAHRFVRRAAKNALCCRSGAALGASRDSRVQSEIAWGADMKWITRERVKVDRVACPWLIKKFIDPDAMFLFVPPDKVLAVAEREHAVPYDVKDVELGHHGKECSFDAIVKRYKLDRDPPMVLLAKIVNGADTETALWNQPAAYGLKSVAECFRHLDSM